MPSRGKVTCYLVIPFALAADGMWVKEAETVCFDYDLAIEIAEADSQFTAGVGVYPLDQDGVRLTALPVAWYGAIEPPTDSALVAAFPPASTIRVDHITGPAQAALLAALQVH
ncbi:hypothetical protein V5F53_12165 [Xanthobacter sp. V4C-4]|uniref:hypothetical protein n=1 Tax=Xanthobacter cornucopiae TaxID=3119924 RepID=UPI003726A03F